MSAPILYITDKDRFYDTRQPGTRLLNMDAAAQRLKAYDPKFTDASILMDYFKDVMENGVKYSDLIATKKLEKNGPSPDQIWDELRTLIPLYKRTNGSGQSQVYIITEQNEAQKIDYETVDNLIDALMYRRDVWAQLREFFVESPLLEHIRAKNSFGQFLKQMLATHWTYDERQSLEYEIQQISWDPEVVAYKQMNAAMLKPGETPTWDEFTSRVDFPEVFMAWVWSIFEPTNNIRQVLWLKGQGNDGKSSVQRAIESIIGKQYCYSLKSGDEKDKWFQRNVFGKVLVNYADCRNIYLISENSIKQLTGGDTTSIEGKGENSFTGRIYSKVLVTSNYAPKINLELQAETSRLIKLDVSPQLDTKKDAQFEQRLAKEFYAFLSKCQNAYFNLAAPGSDKLILPDELQQKISSDCASEMYLNLEDFVQDYIEFNPAETCKPSELNIALKDFLSIEKRLSSDNVRYYKTDLDAKLNLKGCVQARLGPEGQQQTLWTGFKLKKRLTTTD